MNPTHKEACLSIAILLTAATAAGHAQQEEAEQAGTSTKTVISPQLDEIATKLFENYQALSNVAFTYTFDVNGKHKFKGSYVSREGKVRLERKDLSTPYEVIYMPGQANDPTPRHYVHVFDGTRHYQLSLPENSLHIKTSALFAAPYGLVDNPIGAQYSWHVFPGVDGFGVQIRDRNAWKERFADVQILGEEVVNGWDTTVVAIRSFPTLRLDLEGRHTKLYLSHEHNFTPVKNIYVGKKSRTTVVVSRLGAVNLDETSAYVPLEIQIGTSGEDGEFRYVVDERSIVAEPVVDESTFTIVPPPDVEILEPERRKLLPGILAPDFEVTTIDGKSVKLSEMRDKLVLLNFWSSGPRFFEQAARLQTLFERYITDPRLVMISIGNKKHEAEFRKYLDEHPMPWSQVLLSDQDDENIMRMMERYLVREFRHTYLIGTDGGVIQRFGLRGEDIDRFVERELMPKD